MRFVDKLYGWLAGERSSEADRALAAGLAHAEPPYFEQIVQVLLNRAQADAWAGLIGHYRRVSPETQEALRANEELWQAGITAAMWSHSIEARANALAAFEDRPKLRLARVLVEGLRDRSLTLRENAARLLRDTAATFWDRLPPCVSGPDTADDAGYETDRQQLTQALGDALRTFDNHRRREAVEAALWFAPDLGDTLWDVLGRRRSRCASVVIKNLPAWNHPRLAGFLLLGLSRTEWRPTVRPLLRGWESAAEMIALLRHTDLLADASIRSALATIKHSWFRRLDTQMSEIPASLHPRVPTWVCALGWQDDEKARCLAKWATSPLLDVQRATVRALTTLDSGIARARLERIARGSSPMASYARWHLSGCAASAPAADEARVPEVPADQVSSRLADFWPLYLRTAPQLDREAIETIRKNLNGWRPELTSHLRSADPRERVLVFWMIAAVAPPIEFRTELRVLGEDVHPRIRSLARSLLESLPGVDSADETCPSWATSTPSTERTEIVRARQAALRLLFRTLDGWATYSETEAADKLNRLVKRLHAAAATSRSDSSCVRENAR